ncbi:centrosome-associated protein CEP250-like [Phaenicophaeus curvirostris]|uniref:centrosome-associated protein CEP250-like n=1 Tax=Phaenicophaeus curvirostris TaxID=33595 RepID=UPI0037F0DB0C
MKEQRENAQNVTEKLQTELQERQSEIKAVRVEMNILVQQRNALQKQVEACLKSLEIKNSQWEDMEHQNMKFWTSLKVLESKNARLNQSLKERKVKVRILQESNLAQHKQVSRLLSAIEQSQQQHSNERREVQALHNQIELLQEEVLEREADLATGEKQLLQDLEKSRASEQCLRDSLHRLEDEMCELRLRLCHAEDTTKALAAEEHSLVWDQILSPAGDLPAELIMDRVAAALRDLHQLKEQAQQDLNDARNKIEDLELELSKTQAEKDHFSAQNQELHKQLAQSQEESQMAERQATVQAARREEAALEKARSLQEEVATLERKLEDTEAFAEGQQQSWLSEKSFLLQQLECLQGMIAKLEEEKTELKEFNAELKRTLKEVEHERRKLRRFFKHQSLQMPD